MTTADKFGFPQGSPLFDVSFRAISEAFAGNGILASGDFAITEGTADMDLDIAPGTAWYDATEYSEGATTTLTVAAADASNDRWDTVVYDTAATTPAPTIRTGTAAATPEPPGLQAGDLLLGYVYVPAGASDVPQEHIYEWRATASRAADAHLADAPSLYATDTVEDALTAELQYAAQLAGYPLPNSDLSNSTVTVNAGTGLSATNAAVGLGGSSTLSVPEGGISSTEIADGTIVTGDIADGTIVTGDIADETIVTGDIADGTIVTGDIADGTILDEDISTETTLARGKLDHDRTITTVAADTTTNGEEVVFVDSSGGPMTLTLASADTTPGAVVVVQDAAGSASTNAITIATEGTELIEGQTTLTVSTDYAGTTLVSDGANWFTPAEPGSGSGSGGGSGTESVDPTAQIEGAESGAVAAGEQGVLVFDHLADGETVEITKGIFALTDGTAAPSGLNLIIATLDNTGGYTERATIFSGDGATVWDGNAHSVGSPLASWTNATGAATTVAVLADNQTAGSVTLTSKVTGTVGTGSGTESVDPVAQVEGAESGAVAAGEQGVLVFDHLADGETVEIYKSVFVLADGTAAPSGLNLVIATLDNTGGYTAQTTIFSGDGATIWDGDPANSVGSPLASWTNATGAATTVAVLADNQTAGAVSLMAKVTGEVIV